MATTPVRPPLSAGNNSAEPKPKTAVDARFYEPRTAPNVWFLELSKFKNNQVTVDFMMGEQLVSITGKLVAFRGDSLHVIVDCDAETILVRLPLRVTRARKHPKALAEVGK
jgi:hypothetical protein